jgi:hypothetical protein
MGRLPRTAKSLVKSIMTLDTYFFDGPTKIVQEKIHSWNCARREPARALCVSGHPGLYSAAQHARSRQAHR